MVLISKRLWILHHLGEIEHPHISFVILFLNRDEIDLLLKVMMQYHSLSLFQIYLLIGIRVLLHLL